MSFIFGSPSKKTSTSQNTNNPYITGAYSGTVGNGTTANNFLTSLLTGTGDTGAANSGYQSYLTQAGYQPALTQLSRSITGQGAAAGLLNSGATAQALETKGTLLNNQLYNNYLQQLSGLSGLGLAAGGLIANAGQQSQGSDTGGMPSIFGGGSNSTASGIGNFLAAL